MWEYTDKVMELYRNPQNVGEIEDATVIGEAGSIACGDSLKIYLKLDENEIITDAKFQTFGCGSAVAASSALTTMLIGKHISEAEKITNKDIAEFLGGLPPEKMHCSVMGREALDDALANYHGKAIEKDPSERVVCKCFGTTEGTIRDTVKNNDITDVCGMTNYCKTGGACQKCQSDVEQIISDEIEKKQAEANSKPETKPLTKTQLIIKVNEVLANEVAEKLKGDGGDIELFDVDDYKVYVKMLGFCKNCPGSSNTIKNIVEKTLKEKIDSRIEVIEAE